MEEESKKLCVTILCILLLACLWACFYYYWTYTLIGLAVIFFIASFFYRNEKKQIPPEIITMLVSCYLAPAIICIMPFRSSERAVVGVVAYVIAMFLAYWICGKRIKKIREEEHKEKIKIMEEEHKEKIAYYGLWQFIKSGNPVKTRARNLDILNSMSKGYIIIDACVWMAGVEFDCFYEDLFKVLKENGGKITISADILDELARLKTDLSDKKRSGARRGLTRIEKFQNNGLIKTHGVKKVANPNAYADKSIIDFFLKSDDSTLITFDKELRIRLNAKLEEENLTYSRQVLHIKTYKI